MEMVFTSSPCSAGITAAGPGYGQLCTDGPPTRTPAGCPGARGRPCLAGSRPSKISIGTAWEHETAAGLNPAADEDVIPLKTPTGWDGDEIKNHGEYRGIIYTEGINGPLRHLRLDPKKNDLFIKHQGYDQAS